MTMKQLQIVWGAMLGGVIAYTLIAYSLMTFGGLDIAGFRPTIMNAIGGIVILYMFAALVARRALLAGIPKDASPQQRFARYQVAVLMGAAGIEGGGLLMITASLVSGAPKWTLAGGAASAVVLLMARPTAAEAGLG